MKKRLLSAFLAVMMVLTMAPVAFAVDTETTTEYVAQVGDKNYATLADAIAAANDGDTITLLKGGNGNGFKVPEGKFTEQGLTIDFNQFTYMIGGQLVGSAGTGTNGCQLLQNNKITFKNGSFVGATEGSKPADDTPDWHGAPAIMIQNYCDLTLENMIVTGGDETVYTFSNNCGNIVIKDSTINAGKAKSYGSGPFAFDVCRYSTYPSVSVTVQGSSVINGDVEISGTIGEGQSRQLNIEDGTFNGRFVVSNTPANISITGGKFSSDVSAYVAEGYVQNENGTVEQLGATNAVAEVGGTYYKTLADAVAAAQSGATVKLLANINGQTVIPADKNIVLDLNGKTMTHTGTTLYNSGTLVVKDSSADKSGKIVSTGNVGIGVNHNSTTTIEYANIQAQEGAVITGYATGATITIEDGVFTALDNAVVAGNGNKIDKNTEGTPERVNANKITINGGTFNGTIMTSGYVACGIYAPWKDNIVVNGGTFNITGGAGIVARGGIVVVNNGEFNTTGNATGKVGDSRVVVPCSALVFDSAAKYPSLTNDSKIQVNDGKFKSAVDTIKVVKDDTDMNSRVIVGGGYFTTDPSAYCVTGKTGVPSGNTTYPWTVGTIKVKDENEIKTDTQKGTTQANLGSAINEKDKKAATAVGESVTPTKLADTTPITADDKAQALTELVKNNKVKLDPDGKIPNGTTVTVVKETYLDVTVTAYDTKSDTVSMNIVPKYNLIAVAKNGNSADAKIVLKSAQDAKVGSTEVEVTLPDAFKGKKVYINHNNGANLYVATADKTTGKVKFTTNGFSPFTFALTNPDVVAEVNGNAYKSLQEAANAANNGGEITVVQNKNLDLTFNTTKSVKVTNKTDGKITVKFNGTNKEIAKDKTETFSYTKPSSSGGSSSGKTTFKVVTSSVNNGGVNASPSSADKGAVITITLSPDKGYKLDKLTVTDGSGKTIATTKKSDTVYTFTMPASQVKVGVTYVKADTAVTPSTGFNDVASGDWFADAVKYVVDKGMMNGTGTNTFAPKANTTRGMIVTVLYRLENEPNTSAASFTDVAAGQYYNNAVAWANANGIVTGYGNSKFGPNDKITREQLAAILYRYAQYKKYDVSASASLSSYVDAQSVSSYATSAAEWACGAGVVTGKTGSKLDPKGSATRAEVAAMLMRFCENVAK